MKNTKEEAKAYCVLQELFPLQGFTPAENLTSTSEDGFHQRNVSYVQEVLKHNHVEDVLRKIPDEMILYVLDAVKEDVDVFITKTDAYKAEGTVSYQENTYPFVSWFYDTYSAEYIRDDAFAGACCIAETVLSQVSLENGKSLEQETKQIAKEILNSGELKIEKRFGEFYEENEYPKFALRYGVAEPKNEQFFDSEFRISDFSELMEIMKRGYGKSLSESLEKTFSPDILKQISMELLVQELEKPERIKDKSAVRKPAEKGMD